MWLSGRAFALHVKGPGFDPRHLQYFLVFIYNIFLRLIKCISFVRRTKKIALYYEMKAKITLSAGFEPAREDPNGFLVHRLNHSATTTVYI